MALSKRQNQVATGNGNAGAGDNVGAEDNLGEGLSSTHWSPLRRALFRFVCVYLVVYNLPFPLNILPQGFPPYDNFWNALAVWAGRHLFHQVVEITPSGSGDTAAGWVQVFCCLAIAVLTTVLWTLLDRKRPHYDRLYDWLRVYVRFALAATMVSYGADKIIPTQFPPPSLDRLMEPIGDASPMGLLWTFMGASAPYQIFGGVLEMLGALLLTARHTTLLGALILGAVLSNVVALNFCYDVPVKILSVNLLLMAVFLAAPYIGRLVDMFIRGRAVGPMPLRRLFQSRRLDRTALALRTLFVAGLLWMALWPLYQNSLMTQTASRSPLYGIWAVEQWNVNGAVRPPLITDTEQWHRVVFDNPVRVGVQTVSGERHRFALMRDTTARTLTLKRSDDPAWSSTFTYAQPQPGMLTLAGTMDGQKIQVKLHREDAQNFLLVRRGFHWVNEFPYNR